MTSGKSAMLSGQDEKDLEAADVARGKKKKRYDAIVAGTPLDADTDDSVKPTMRKGGAVKKMAKGGSTSKAASRGDGIAKRGKTRGALR